MLATILLRYALCALRKLHLLDPLEEPLLSCPIQRENNL